MSEMSRREAIAGMMVLGVAATRAKADVDVNAATGDLAGGAKVFAVDAIPVVKQANGGERRVVLNGSFATGESVRVHETHVPEGAAAPALHVIQHSELVFVQEGTLEFMREGSVQKATAGDVIYVAYGTKHAIRNAGPGMARYKVCAVGGDVKKS